jgi:hypothetical protein
MRKQHPSQFQFKIFGKRLTENKWSVIEVHDVHNHEASSDISGRQSSRKLNDIQKTKVRELAAAGVRPTQILTTVKNDSPGCGASRKTLYNELFLARKEFLDGRRPVEALFDVLRDGPYIYHVDVGPIGTITRLFFLIISQCNWRFYMAPP